MLQRYVVFCSFEYLKTLQKSSKSHNIRKKECLYKRMFIFAEKKEYFIWFAYEILKIKGCIFQIKNNLNYLYYEFKSIEY